MLCQLQMAISHSNLQRIPEKNGINNMSSDIPGDDSCGATSTIKLTVQRNSWCSHAPLRPDTPALPFAYSYPLHGRSESPIRTLPIYLLLPVFVVLVLVPVFVHVGARL